MFIGYGTVHGAAEEAFVERRGRLQDERANLLKRMEVANGQTASQFASLSAFLFAKVSDSHGSSVKSRRYLESVSQSADGRN